MLYHFKTHPKHSIQWFLKMKHDEWVRMHLADRIQKKIPQDHVPRDR